MTVLNMDCLLGLKLSPSNYADAIVTDPPYELGFMGKSWDASGIAYSVELWREALRVLKPGGHLLAFSGSRTYHRMACAIEDAGFEIRDQIMWVYGSGFPKSLNVAKAIESGGGRPEDIRRMQMGDGYAPSGRGRANYDHGGASAMNGVAESWAPATEAAREWEGWGTALKPAHEPICVARKPLIGTVAANVLAHGTGALNIDACRVNSGPVEIHARTATMTAATAMAGTPTGSTGTGEFHAGRWPANLIHDGSAEVLAAFPNAAGAQGIVRADESSASTANSYGQYDRRAASTPRRESDTSAARFFYCAKASKADRGPGNTHPTVKPTAVIQYLMRLVTPPGGLVLDLFNGSGTGAVAAKREGFRYLGFEISAEYCEITQRRINVDEPVSID